MILQLYHRSDILQISTKNVFVEEFQAVVWLLFRAVVG